MGGSNDPRIFDDPENFLRMGQGLAGLGHARQAIELAERALRERPDDGLLRAMAREITAGQIEGFHGAMLEDRPRNQAYRAAIESLASGRRVLDIGTGSGLLAMFAARGGAAAVHACERDTRLAVTAQEIVAANGLAGQITVHGCGSTELDAERDLGGRADLVVTEIFAENLLKEGFIASLRDARERLCREDALYIPARAAIRVALAAYPDAPPPLREVEGFDISLFSRHLRQQFMVRQSNRQIALCSPAADLFAFDLASPIAPSDRASFSLELTDAPATGVVQWIRLDLAPGVVFENGPGSTSDSHWRMVYSPMPELAGRQPGDTVQLNAWRDELSYRLWI
jgi:type III protein arginine methyltransferase